MAKPLSEDLRRRVISAVDGGVSRRAAAERFGVSVSAAIKWTQAWHRTGNCKPKRQGGDKRSHRIEAHAEEILALVEADCGITLAEIAAALEERHGTRFSGSVIWRFFDRREITYKKNRARQRTAKA